MQRIIGDLNGIFAEAEESLEWEPSFYADVYTRIKDSSQQLVDVTKGGR